MAERVIDVLEAVDVDHQHGEQRALALGLREPVRKALVEQEPIRQRRQMVCPHEIVQPLFHPLAIANVA